MNLKSIRIRKELTQSELASKCGVTQQAVSQYESGYREPDLETLKKLASALGCTVDELLQDPPESADDQGGA